MPARSASDASLAVVRATKNARAVSRAASAVRPRRRGAPSSEGETGLQDFYEIIIDGFFSR